MVIYSCISSPVFCCFYQICLKVIFKISTRCWGGGGEGKEEEKNPISSMSPHINLAKLFIFKMLFHTHRTLH